MKDSIWMVLLASLFFSPLAASAGVCRITFKAGAEPVEAYLKGNPRKGGEVGYASQVRVSRSNGTKTVCMDHGACFPWRSISMSKCKIDAKPNYSNQAEVYYGFN